jgi:small-conductance mechanosensitive channel
VFGFIKPKLLERQHLIRAIFHFGAWLGIIVLVHAGLPTSPSRDAYAVLNAWWITAYIAVLVKSGWREALLFLVFVSVSIVIDTTIGSGYLYHDAPDVSSFSFVVILLLLGLLWMSPFLVSAVVIRLRGKLLGTTADMSP